MTDPAQAGFEKGVRSKALRAPIRWPDDLPGDDTSDEQKRRAGVVAGHLVGAHVAAGDAVTESRVLAEAAYAAALVSPQGQRYLGDLTGASVLSAHVYCCILAERHGHTFSEEDETWLFSWVLAQAGLEPRPELLDDMHRKRARRLERDR